MQDFIKKLLCINPSYDAEFIERAYLKAEELHKDQLRKSGEPYLIHPIAVANILAELGLDDRALVAGLLHDVVEDTDYKLSDVEKDFGAEATGYEIDISNVILFKIFNFFKKSQT